MGLVIVPVYGLFFYLYVTYLIMSGAPFTSKENVKHTNESANISSEYGQDFDFMNTTGTANNYREDEPDFEPLMSPQIRHFIGLGIGGGTGLALTIYSVFSREVRCSMLLMVPSLLTKRGRGFMLTFVTSLLIEGPINTIEHNLQELVQDTD